MRARPPALTRTIPILLLILGAIIGTGVVCKATRLQASLDTSFTVNNPTDATDADPGNGVCETAPGNQVCTLRAAVQETNALTGTDTIVLPAGTYTLTIPGSGEDSAATGDLDITGDLTIMGADAATTIITGNGIGRVLHVFGSAKIYSVTIASGATDSIPGGGGILNESSLALIDSAITGSQSVNFETAPCALPDLVVTSAQAMPSSGKVGFFTKVTVGVKNQGDSVAEGPFKVTWRYGLGDNEYCEWTVHNNLDPGTSKYLQCQRAIMRTYTTIATVDVNDDVKESDEDNNEAQSMVSAH